MLMLSPIVMWLVMLHADAKPPPPPQVDAGLTFNKKDLEHSFIFDITTIDRVFYLVADTEDDMNKWVRYICDICGFNPTDDGNDDASHAHTRTVHIPAQARTHERNSEMCLYNEKREKRRNATEQ